MRQIIISTIFICAFCFRAFAQEPDVDCPTISVTGPDYASRPGEHQLFAANIGQVVERYDVKYEWSISSGKIVSGQGTKNLTVVNESDQSLTVTLEVKGLPEKCPNMASEAATIASAHNAIFVDGFDTFGQSGTKGKLDSFFVQLQNDKFAEGIIVFRNDKDLLHKVKFLRAHTAFRQLPETRLTIVISDDPGQLTQFWRVPVGDDLKTWEGNLIINLEDFEKLQKIFQPVLLRRKTKK